MTGLEQFYSTLSTQVARVSVVIIPLFIVIVDKVIYYEGVMENLEHFSDREFVGDKGEIIFAYHDLINVDITNGNGMGHNWFNKMLELDKKIR